MNEEAKKAGIGVLIAVGVLIIVGIVLSATFVIPGIVLIVIGVGILLSRLAQKKTPPRAGE